MFHRLFCQSIDASTLLPLRKIRWPTTWSIKEVLMFQAQKLLLWQCEMSTWSWCCGRSSYSYWSPFHWVSQFFDKLNLRSWSVPATPFVRAQWSSWRLTPGTVVQWRCDTSTHRYGVTWVMHRSHRCRCLDVPLFERGYGKECLFLLCTSKFCRLVMYLLYVAWGSSWHCEECNCSREIQRLRPWFSMLLSVYALNESLLPLLRSWCCSSWYSRTNAGSPQYQGGRFGVLQNGKRQRSQQFAPRIMNHWCERSQNWSPSTVLTWSGSKLENRGKFNIQSIAAYGISWTLNFQKISSAHLKGSFCWWSAGRQWCNRSGRAESEKKPPLAPLLPWIIYLSLFNHFFL